MQDRTHDPSAVESPSSPVDGENVSALDDDESKPKPKDALDVAAEEEEVSYGFAHPAASRPQRTVWIPKDEFGLAEEEERACREMGVLVSDVHATINAKGGVDVDGGPPDYI